MKAVKSKNTGPELLVRKLLHSLGFRYRLHRRDLPGTPDIVLPGRRIAIFVHGCYWHGHGCSKGQLAKSNTTFWSDKIRANQVRDARNLAELTAKGWTPVVIWQCELRDLEDLQLRLVRLLQKPIDEASRFV